MPCAAGLECKIPDNTPAPGQSKDHSCYGGCDGALHGLCGRLVPAAEEESDSEMHRMCTLCHEYNYGTGTAATNKRKASNWEEGEGDVAPKKKKKEAASTAVSRVRLTLKQKGEVLGLVEEKVTYNAIATQFGCAEKTVKNIVRDQKVIRKQLEDAGSSSGLVNAKASRKPQHPEIEHRVELCLKGARNKGLAVNRAMIQQFGVQSKADLLETDFLSDETKARVQHFEGGIKWCRNFMSRHGIRGTRAKGGAGSVQTNGSLRAPPKYSEISAQIGFLEEMAEACGIERATEGIQMAKMAFLLASAT